MPNRGREEPGGRHSGHHNYPEGAKSDGGGKVHPANKSPEKNSRADAKTPAGKDETPANSPGTERQWQK